MYKSDEALKQSIDQRIEANQNDFVKDLAKLVAIPSISVENDGPWPFGEECKNVLDKATEIAGEYGFTVVNHEYHCGSCVVPGTGEHPKRIGMCGILWRRSTVSAAEAEIWNMEALSRRRRGHSLSVRSMKTSGG